MIRWRKRVKREWREGDIRVVRRFLLWPVCIGDEWRWLGLSLIKQKLCRVFDPNSSGYRGFKWFNVEWVDGR